MTADPIRDALEASACALCREAKSCRDDCGGKCAWREADVNMPACAATAVAAFLRALPACDVMMDRPEGAMHSTRTLAADVERAAKEGA